MFLHLHSRMLTLSHKQILANEFILAAQLNYALIIDCCDRDFWKKPFRLYLMYLSKTLYRNAFHSYRFKNCCDLTQHCYSCASPVPEGAELVFLSPV